MTTSKISSSLESILRQYGESFTGKEFRGESSEVDDLMLVFGLTQDMKTGNRQYWGRELGMCWQKLITQLCQAKCDTFKGPIREGKDEFCDLVVKRDAIDTKYRIGSGDSGTLKKFKLYGNNLRDKGYKPILLILRKDNLPAAITACQTGGWEVLMGEESFRYIKRLTKFDLQAWLAERKSKFSVKKQ